MRSKPTTGDLLCTMTMLELTLSELEQPVTDPGDGNLYVEGTTTLGNLTSSPSYIKGLRIGGTTTPPGYQNLYVEGNTTAVGQITTRL